MLHWYQWHRWQTFPPFSLALLIPVANLPPVSMIQAANLPPVSTNVSKRNQNIYQIEDFFHLPPASTTPVANLELRISPRIFEKIRNGPYGIIRGLGETDSWKNQKQKISWHCSFKEALDETSNRLIWDFVTWIKTGLCQLIQKGTLTADWKWHRPCLWFLSLSYSRERLA